MERGPIPIDVHGGGRSFLSCLHPSFLSLENASLSPSNGTPGERSDLVHSPHRRSGHLFRPQRGPTSGGSGKSAGPIWNLCLPLDPRRQTENPVSA